MDTLLDILSHNTRFLRKEKEMTQEKLAEHAGLSVNEIGKIERGKVSPKVTALEKLAIGFNVEVGRLIDYRLDPHASFSPQGELAKAITRESSELSENDQQVVLELIRSIKRHYEK